VPRHGISLKGIEPQRLAELVDLSRTGNAIALVQRATCNNTIAYNEVFSACMESSDSGAIDSWYTGPDNVIASNVVYSSGGPVPAMTSGISLDDGTTVTTVRGNIVSDIRGAFSSCVSVKGMGNALIGNLFIASTGNTAVVRSSGWTCPAQNLSLSANIFCTTVAGSAMHLFMRWERRTLKASNSNLYWNAVDGPVSFAGRVPATDYAGWRKIYGGRFDSASMIANPLLRAMGRGMYLVPQKSPSAQLGYESLLPGSVGITAMFPHRLLTD
jgi:hypothetical protein